MTLKTVPCSSTELATLELERPVDHVAAPVIASSNRVARNKDAWLAQLNSPITLKNRVMLRWPLGVTFALPFSAMLLLALLSVKENMEDHIVWASVSGLGVAILATAAWAVLSNGKASRDQKNKMICSSIPELRDWAVNHLDANLTSCQAQLFEKIAAKWRLAEQQDQMEGYLLAYGETVPNNFEDLRLKYAAVCIKNERNQSNEKNINATPNPNLPPAIKYGGYGGLGAGR